MIGPQSPWDASQYVAFAGFCLAAGILIGGLIVVLL